MRHKVRCGQLKSNGLRFYTQYDSGSTNEMAVICIKAGSLHDPAGLHGLAHLVEHVIFCDRSRYTEEDVALLFARTMGGPDDLRGIYTMHAVTAYGPIGPIRKPHNRKLFPVFSEIVRVPSLADETFSSERAAVIAELYLRDKEVIGVRLFEELYRSVFPESFAAYHPIIGYSDEICSATLKDIEYFIHKYYVPENTFVVFFGPKHEEARHLIENELGGWISERTNNTGRRNGLSKQQIKGGFRPLSESHSKIIADPAAYQYHVAVGFPTENYMSEDAEALDVLSRILSERMYHRLRVESHELEKGVYRTPVDTYRSFAHGIFSFYFATSDRQNSREGINIFHEECQRLCVELVSRAELEAWVGYMCDYEFKNVFSISPQELAQDVIISVANGDSDLKKLHARGDKLKSFLLRNGRQKLRDVARQYLSGHSATVIFEPK